MADEHDKGYLDFIEAEFREQQRALLLAFGKWRVEHGMTAFLAQDVDAFLGVRQPQGMGPEAAAWFREMAEDKRRSGDHSDCEEDGQCCGPDCTVKP